MCASFNYLKQNRMNKIIDYNVCGMLNLAKLCLIIYQQYIVLSEDDLKQQYHYINTILTNNNKHNNRVRKDIVKVIKIIE